jgi:hypothetical protein
MSGVLAGTDSDSKAFVIDLPSGSILRNNFQGFNPALISIVGSGATTTVELALARAKADNAASVVRAELLNGNYEISNNGTKLTIWISNNLTTTAGTIVVTIPESQILFGNPAASRSASLADVDR